MMRSKSILAEKFRAISAERQKARGGSLTGVNSTLESIRQLKFDVPSLSVKFPSGFKTIAPEPSRGVQLPSQLGGISSMAAGLLDTIDAPNAYGVRSNAGAVGSGFLKGAATGSALGPIGAGVGAIVGGLTSFIGNKRAKTEQDRQMRRLSMQERKNLVSESRAKVATDPFSKYGNPDAQMYRLGGTLKGKPAGKFNLSLDFPKNPAVVDLLPDVATRPNKLMRKGGIYIKPSKRGTFTTAAKEKGMGVQEFASKVLSNKENYSSAMVKKANFARNASKWKKKAEGGEIEDPTTPPRIYMKAKDGEYYTPNPAYSVSWRAKVVDGQEMPVSEEEFQKNRMNDAYMTRLYDIEDSLPYTVPDELKMTPEIMTQQRVAWKSRNSLVGGKLAKRATGGKLSALSSDVLEVKGKDHAQGGVKFPELGVELEGGETVAGDFVFSEDLGIAQLHKKTARGMASNEKRPATPLNKNTQQALKRQEGFLKIHQERIKKAEGVPNEIDNTARKSIEQERTTPNLFKKGGKLPKMQNGGDPPTKKLAIPEEFIGPWYWAGEPPIEGGELTPVEVVSTRLGPKATPSPRETAEKGIAALKEPITPVASNLSSKLTSGVEGINPSVDPRFPSFETKGATSEVSTAASGRTGVNLKREGRKASEVIDTLAPFASNIVNAFRRLPNPPAPSSQRELSPALINLDASRAEAVRARRSADKMIERNLASGTAIAASKAANLSQQVREYNAINQNEANANAQIKNQFQALNAQIRAENQNRRDTYNQQLVEKELKQQQLSAENIADVANKIQLIKRDKRLFDLEDTRLLLTMAQDETGATWRAGKDIILRAIEDPKTRQEFIDMMKAKEKERRAMNAEELKILKQAVANLVDAKAEDSLSPEGLRNSTQAIIADSQREKERTRRDK